MTMGSGELAEESRVFERLPLTASDAMDEHVALLQSMHRAVWAESVSSARAGVEKNAPASNMPANFAIPNETFVWVNMMMPP